jgi:hypothetical protein
MDFNSGVVSNEYPVDISEKNPNLTGFSTNRIMYSGFRFKKDKDYVVEIPEGAVISNQTFGAEGKHKYNVNQTCGLTIESSHIYITHFLDMDNNHWAYAYVQELTEKQIISGYEDGTFKPARHVTRSEFATMTVTSLKIPTREPTDQTYVDIDPGRWDYKYVEAVKPYLPGYSDGRDKYFNGGKPALREEMAAALVRAMKLENEDVDISELESIFTDHESISQDLKSYVLIAYKNGIIGGYPDNTFRARQSITRAEAAALISRVLALGTSEPEESDQKESDVLPDLVE